jgi:HSP20 family protein
MSLSRYNLGLSPAVRDEFKQAFDVFNKLANLEEGDQSNVVTSQWAPRVDIKEEAGRFLILADIPGVDPKDIEISMDKGILTIKGERSSESTDERERYTRLERSRGLFYRRFALPDSADAEAIKASGKHGVLEIVIPKRPETTPRRITID